MRVAVTGGRVFSDDALVEEVLDEVWAQATGEFFLIHGEGSGVDAIANAWGEAKRARGFKLGILRFPAEWRVYGRAAGPIRNQRMITYGEPDMLVAFPGGRGTADMIHRCEEAGIRIRRVPPRLPGVPARARAAEPSGQTPLP